MFSNQQLRDIFQRTSGHCHFCGDKLRLENYGDSSADEPIGAWEADHVIQRGKGGSKSPANCYQLAFAAIACAGTEKENNFVNCFCLAWLPMTKSRNTQKLERKF